MNSKIYRQRLHEALNKLGKCEGTSRPLVELCAELRRAVSDARQRQSAAEITFIQARQHAHQELQHALIISRQIDCLGKMPTVTPKPVKVSEKPSDMLKFDSDNEDATIINYRE